MIGQQKLLETLRGLVTDKNFPRFLILVGQKGSGKKMLSTSIAEWLCATCVMLEDVKVDTIRDMIKLAYKQVKKTIYIIPEADTMSNSAKNALLKVTEEPPYNSYFIMTAQDENQLLATIKSRAVLFHMEQYSVKDIIDYYNSRYYNDEKSMDYYEIIGDICETPAEVDELYGYGIIPFQEYVNLVISNVADVSGANSFKIADRLAVKNADTDKYDLRLFWKVFMRLCMKHITEQDFDKTVTPESEVVRYADGIKITTKYLQELNINGINKQMTFDAWLLDLRKAWR